MRSVQVIMAVGLTIALALALVSAVALAQGAIPTPPYVAASPFVSIATDQVGIIVAPQNSTYILEAVGSARCCVYIEAYELTYQPLVNELADLARHGVSVYVVLSGNVYGGIPEEEYSAVEELTSAGVHVSFNDMYGYVHSKVFVIDNETVILGSINPTYYGFERDLGIDLVIHNASIARVYAGIILSDYYNESVTQVSYPGIVVSPINSAEYLDALLNQPGALYMAFEELYPSSGFYGLIQQHSDRVVLVGEHSENYYAVSELGAVMVPGLTAKAIVVGDYVYVGSVNLDYESLHNNRELGIIIENPVIAEEVRSVVLQWYSEYAGQAPKPTTNPTSTPTTVPPLIYYALAIALIIIFIILYKLGKLPPTF
jgi:phosphatidylserine/phosphatidylglycerophosphate/cardiolipin synthase-like enzyme